MTRRNCIALAAAALAADSSLKAKDTNTMKELLEACQTEKKSVMLFVKGQSLGGLVVRVTGETAELRNREYSRFVVRIDSIDAAAMS